MDHGYVNTHIKLPWIPSVRTSLRSRQQIQQPRSAAEGGSKDNSLDQFFVRVAYHDTELLAALIHRAT